MNEESITFTDNGDNSLTLRISGVAYQNLSKMAEVMNEIPWGDFTKDNTALTVAESFIFRHETIGLIYPKDALELAEGIADSLDYETTDEAEEKTRCHALYKAFRKVKFLKG